MCQVAYPINEQSVNTTAGLFKSSIISYMLYFIILATVEALAVLLIYID